MDKRDGGSLDVDATTPSKETKLPSRRICCDWHPRPIFDTVRASPPADNSALVEEKTARAPALSLYSPVVGLEVEEAEMLRYFML